MTDNAKDIHVQLSIENGKKTSNHKFDNHRNKAGCGCVAVIIAAALWLIAFCAQSATVGTVAEALTVIAAAYCAYHVVNMTANADGPF